MRRDSNMPNQQYNRLEILNQLLQSLQKWDGTSTQANEIIEKNNVLLAELKEIDNSFNQKDNRVYSRREQEQAAAIIEGQQSLLAVIKKDRKVILDKMKQMNQKNKVVDNYYSSFQQPIFVDRGM